MKSFSTCPKCKQVMSNTIISNIYLDGTLNEMWNIYCSNTLNHKLSLLVNPKDNNIIRAILAITMAFNKRDAVYAEWNFILKNLILIKGKSSFALNFKTIPHSMIPFFEPDFSQYDKLIKKLKTYVVFS